MPVFGIRAMIVRVLDERNPVIFTINVLRYLTNDDDDDEDGDDDDDGDDGDDDDDGYGRVRVG